MTHAYQEIYLSKAQSVLGDAFDYAINSCKFAGNDFIKLFIASSVSQRMERGEPDYINGKSGIEIVAEILEETKGERLIIKSREHFGRSKEYWAGWAVAYYQWYSERKYSDIFKVVSFDELVGMYYPLHEADITKFVDIMDVQMDDYFPETNLKRIRVIYGLTQAELAKRSNVSLRSIQMYEQRNKNINKASADALYNLAKVLGCTMEDLIEK
ncbi:helix-turn-helix domain-containing protein [bacterium 210820-DFI.6.37]|nr:helix-turn-helix domain-containing protein [bacterium 210820-DFI.6.37]